MYQCFVQNFPGATLVLQPLPQLTAESLTIVSPTRIVAAAVFFCYPSKDFFFFSRWPCPARPVTSFARGPRPLLWLPEFFSGVANSPACIPFFFATLVSLTGELGAPHPQPISLSEGNLPFTRSFWGSFRPARPTIFFPAAASCALSDSSLISDFPQSRRAQTVRRYGFLGFPLSLAGRSYFFLFSALLKKHNVFTSLRISPESRLHLHFEAPASWFFILDYGTAAPAPTSLYISGNCYCGTSRCFRHDRSFSFRVTIFTILQ